MENLLTGDVLSQLFSANRAVADASTHAMLLEAILDNAIDDSHASTIRPDRCVLLKTTQERSPTDFVIVAAWDCLSEKVPAVGTVYNVQTLPILRFLAGGETVVLRGAADTRLSDLDRVMLAEATNGLLLPLRAGRRWAGALIIGMRSETPFDATRVQYYEALADVSALSLYNISSATQVARVSSLLNSLIEHGHYAQIVTDPNGLITDWSPAAEALYGYPIEHTINKPLSLLAPEADAETVLEQYRTVAREQRTVQQQAKRIAQSGQMLDVLMTLYPVYGRSDTVIGVGEISIDHSDRAPLQDAIQKERDHLEAILEATNDAIIMLDIDRRVVTANIQFENFFGLPRYSLVGRTVDDLLRQVQSKPELPNALYNIFVTLSGDDYGSAAGDLEIEVNSRRILVWYSAPVHAHEGTTLGRLFVFRDATQEREADRMKTDFVSLVSHELRTPLTSLKGFTDLIMDGDAGPLEGPVREYMKIIQFNTDRLISLVNDILDVTRLESGHIDLRRTSVDLTDAAASAVAPMRLIFEGKQQSLVMHIPKGLPLVWVDLSRLIQILTNLISNASKYTPTDGTIRVEARHIVEAADLPASAPPSLKLPMILVSVHDTGMGIAPEHQAQLFTRFYRTPTSVKRQLAGTGLGLSIVKSFVELHGGNIWFESEVDHGSSFYFTLPIAG